MTKIMLVEDDATMLSLLATLLDMEGFQVTKVDKFDKVLDVIKNEEPDVILMDIYLEEVDGLEILKSLRKDEILKGIKVIMSSGMEKEFESAEAGADDFLLKPFMPDELITKVKQLV
jgi:two-component system alkaline phosphatase synthesis response regulator PhoP